jgi:hypothetical protein
MKWLSHSFQTIVKYFVDGISRIFSPTDDNYPASGVQPYEGRRTKRRPRWN